jgi:hypothetical protein
MRFALPCFLVAMAASPAFAQKIAVAPFSGPGAAATRAQLVSAICDQAECVSEKKVTTGGKPDWKKGKKEKLQYFVVGKVVAKGKKKTLELQVQNKPGGAKWKKSFPLERELLSDKNLAAASEAIGKALGKKEEAAEPPEEKAPAPEEKKAAVEERKPPPEEKAEVEEPPRRANTTPPLVETTPEPEPSPEPPTKQTRRPVIALELGFDVSSKSFSYSGVQTPNLRSYRAPFIAMPDLKAELYPLALATQGFGAGLGIEGGFALAVGLKSRRTGTDVSYPTSITKLDLGLKFQIRPVANSDAYVAPFVGFRTHSFSVGPGSDNSTLDGLPAVSYTALKFGLSGELPFSNTGLLLYGRFAVMPVMSLPTIVSKDYFPSGSALGIDGGLGLGFKIISALQIRVGFDFTRYGLNFKYAPTDTYIADGAVDQYIGGNAALRFTY